MQETAMVDVGELLPHPQNYQHHPHSQIKRVAASLQRFGQVKPIPIRHTENGLVIVAGHCTVAAIALLAEENRAQWGRVWVTYVPENWTDDMAIGYLVADNETARGSLVDHIQLDELLSRQQFAGYSTASLGFSNSDATRLRASLSEKPQRARQFYLVFHFSTLAEWGEVQRRFNLPTTVDEYTLPGSLLLQLGDAKSEESDHSAAPLSESST